MARIGGEGSNVDTRFLEQYSKIAGKGRSAEEQIAQIHQSVDNKLVNSNKAGQAGETPDGRRKVGGLDQAAATVQDIGEGLSSGVGNLLFGEDASEDNPLEFVGRTLFNLPGGIVGSPLMGLASLAEAGTGNDYEYYDPATQTVPDNEYGRHDTMGKIVEGLSAATNLIPAVKGLGSARALGAATRGGTRAAGNALSRKLGSGATAARGTSAADDAVKGWTSGFSKNVSKARQSYENLASKNIATRIGFNAAEEGIQEAVQEGLEWISTNDELVSSGEATPEDWGDFWDTVGYAAGAGALGGGFVGGVGGLSEQRAKTRKEKLEAATAASLVDGLNTGDQAVNRFANAPIGYRTPDQNVYQAYADASKADKIAGQTPVVVPSDSVGVNSFETGLVPLASIYDYEDGASQIDSKLGQFAEDLQIDLVNAILAPDLYEGGREQAIIDINRVLDAAGGLDGLVWKDPANGYQMKMNLKRVRPENNVWVNQAINKMFNGDFDTDRLGFSFDDDLVGEAIIPSQLFTSDAVEGKVNVDFDYTTFGSWADSNLKRDQVVNALVEGGMTKKEAGAIFAKFKKAYQAAGDDPVARGQVLSQFLSNEGKGLSANVAEEIFGALQLRGDKVKRTAEQASLKQDQLIEQSQLKMVDQTGSVPNNTSPMELRVKLGDIRTSRKGTPLRQAAAWLYETAKSTGMTTLTLPAAVEYALDAQNIMNIGDKPQELVKKAYRDLVAAEVELKLLRIGGRFKTAEDFKTVFIDTVSEMRPLFDRVQYYETLDGKVLIDGFLGTTEPIREISGAIESFSKIMGNRDIDKLFFVPDTWKGRSVTWAFEEVARSGKEYVNLFAEYSNEAEWTNAIKSTYKTAAVNKVKILEEGAKEATTKKLTPDENGIVPADQIDSLNARLAYVHQALGARVANLGLYSVESLESRGRGGFADALMDDSYETLMRLIGSLAAIDECSDLMAEVAAYNADPTIENLENVRFAAAYQAQLLSPPYQLIAADIIAQIDKGIEGQLESSIYNLLSRVHEFDGDRDLLNDILGGIYQEMGLEGSYGDILVDLLVVSNDEMALGQLAENFRKARVFSRRAMMTAEDIAAKHLKDLKAAANLLGDNPHYLVYVLEEMTNEPVLWRDEVMSEMMRSGGWLTNATKEKAKAETFAKMVMAGLQSIEGKYKTYEQSMFSDRVFEVPAEELFSNPQILKEYLFGPPSVTYNVVSVDGSSRLFTKSDFFEWATGKPFNPDGNEDAQILAVIQAKPRILTNLLPRNLTTTAQEQVKQRSKGDAVNYYTKVRNQRSERFAQNRNLDKIRAQIQAEPEAIRYVFMNMLSLNNNEPLPFTDQNKFFDLYQRSMKNIVRAAYQNSVVFSEERTAVQNTQTQKMRSLQANLEKLGDILSRLNASRLASRENMDIVDAVMNQTALDTQKASAAAAVFGDDWGLLVDAGTFNFQEAEALEDVEIAKQISLLQLQAQAIALNRYLPQSTETVSTIRNSLAVDVAAASDEAIIKYAERNNISTADLNEARAQITELLSLYDQDAHDTSSTITAVDLADYVKIERLPGTFDEVSTMDLSELRTLLRGKNVEVDPNTRERAFQKIQRLAGERAAIPAEMQTEMDTEAVRINKLRVVQKRNAIEELTRASNRDPLRFSETYGTLSSAIAEKSAELDRLFDSQITQSVAAIQATYDNKRASIENQYRDIIDIIDNYEFHDIMIKLQAIGDPLNTTSIADLMSANDSFMEFCDRIRMQRPVDEDLPPLLDLEGDDINKGILPEFSALDPSLKEVIANVQVALMGGDVEVGTSAGSIGTGKRSVYGQVGDHRACDAPGEAMSLTEALMDPKVITIRVKASGGDRIIKVNEPSEKLNKLLTMQQGMPDSPVMVQAYRAGECLCSGVCENHNTAPTYNESTKTNAMATFARQLSYFMAEVQQLQKKKTLNADTVSSLFGEDFKNPALVPTKVDAANFEAAMKNIVDFQLTLMRELKDDIDISINQMKEDAQSRLLDRDVFVGTLAEFCTRFVEIQVSLDDGSVMSELFPKNGALQERLQELYAFDGVQSIGIVPRVITLEQSEMAAIRYADSIGGNRADGLIAGLQDRGSYIEQRSDGILAYTDTVTHRAGQLDIDGYYNMSDVLRPGGQILPPGPGTQSPVFAYMSEALGSRQYLEGKPRRGWEPPKNMALSLSKDSDYVALKQLAYDLTGESNYVLVNVDSSNVVGAAERQWVSRLFMPTLANGDVVHFGSNANYIKVNDTDIAMAYLMNPTRDAINRYYSWAEQTNQKTHILVPNTAEAALRDSEYGYTSRIPGFFVIEVDPMSRLSSEGSNGFRAQTIEMARPWLPVVASTRQDIGDGVVYLPTAWEGTPFSAIVTGNIDLTDIKKTRPGEAYIIRADEQKNVLQAYNNKTGKPGEPVILFPESWEGRDERSVDWSFDRYNNADLNEQGIAEHLSTEQSIVAVLRIPPEVGDTAETVTYYPMTMSDLGLGSSAGYISGFDSIDGSGFTFLSFNDETWTRDSIQKYLAEGSAAKATVQLAPDQNMLAANGIEVAEQKMSDVIKKAEEATSSKIKKLVAAYQMPKADGTFRSMYLQADVDRNTSPKPGVNPALTGQGWDKTISSFEDRNAMRKILNGATYKAQSDPSYNQEAEGALRKFMTNCDRLGGSPNKILNPMVDFNGKAQYKVFADKIMDLYFTKMDEDEIFLMFNYITDGEFCPPDTMTMGGSYFINSDYEMRMQNGEYRYFVVSDGTFGADNVSAVDASSNRATLSAQQSVQKLSYTTPAKADFASIESKQRLESGLYERLAGTDEQRIEKMRKRRESKLPAPPPLMIHMDQIAAALKTAAGKATGNAFFTNMADAFQSYRDAYVRPARIVTATGKDTVQDIGKKEWRVLRNQFYAATGQTGSNKWSDARIQRFISNLASWSSQDSGVDYLTFDQAQAILTTYNDRLDLRIEGKKGAFPRAEIMWQDGDPKTARHGACGSWVFLQEEWQLPKVKALFNNDFNLFLEAAGTFQRNQSTSYRTALAASTQKLAMYQYIQLYLQSDLNSRIPGGVGTVDMFDLNGNSDETVNQIMELFGYGSGDAALHEALSRSAQAGYDRLLNTMARNRGAYDARGPAKKDKNGNVIPPSAGRTQTSSMVGDFFKLMYSLRVGNALFMNLALTVSNLGQQTINGKAQQMANRITFYTGGVAKGGIGVQPRNFDAIRQAASDGQLQLFFKLKQMLAWYTDDPTLLDGFFDDYDNTMAKVNATLSGNKRGQRIIRKYARLASQVATANGAGVQAQVENFLFRFGQLLGDHQWLTEHFIDPRTGEHIQIDRDLMTQAEWENYIYNGANLQQFMSEVTHPAHLYNMLYRAASEDSLKISWSRKNIITEIMSALAISIGNSRIPITKDTAESLFAIGVTPFARYLTNFTMFMATAVQGFPSETLLHIAHHRGLQLKQWMQANDIPNDIIDNIDFEAMSSTRNLMEAIIRDAIKFGGWQFLGLVAAGLLKLEPPEKEEIKDNWREWTIGALTNEEGEPFRIRMLWPLDDILGPFGPTAVYWATVMNGEPRPQVLGEGFADMVANSASMTVENFFSFLSDPLLWTRANNDDDMGMMNGANLSEEDDPAIENSQAFFMQGIMAAYRTLVPNFLDQALGGAPGTEYDRSTNYIREVDSAGIPTGRQNPDTGDYYLERVNASEASWRRQTERHTILGYFMNLNAFGSLTAPEGETGYLRGEMPNIVRYNPVQVASAEMYELNGDPVHDQQVAADVVEMLMAYDDLDDLMQTGFYINAETRFYVGQKVWDAYYSYQDQIDQAYALGLNDYEVLGNGDWIEGEKIFNQWKQAMEAQRDFFYDFYYEKLNSNQLRQRMMTANVIRQSYDQDSEGEWYGTGFYNDNPWALFSIGSRYGNAGAEGGWSSKDPLTDIAIGERGWVWNKANSYYDSLPFEAYSKNEDGKGYSAAFIESPTDSYGDLTALADLYNPNNGGSSYGGRGGGGGGGGSSYFPKIYSNPQDLNADYATIARMDRLSDSQLDYLRPDWETKGSREAMRRSDI